MTDFIVIVAAIVVGQLITAALGFAIMLQPAVLKWYSKRVMKACEDMFVDDL